MNLDRRNEGIYVCNASNEGENNKLHTDLVN